MSIWVTIPFLLFALMLAFKRLEKSSIQIQPHKEHQIMSVKERVPLWKIGIFMVLSAIIFFGIQPQTMTVSMTFFKMGLVCAIFFLDSIMKTKLYVTNQHIYLIERFRNRRFVNAKELNTDNIYKVEASRHYEGVYYLYYFGVENATNQLTLHIPKAEERHLFKQLLKDRMNIVIFNEQEHESLRTFKTRPSGIDVFSKFFIWLAFLVVLGAIIQAMKTTNTNLTTPETVISYLMASLAIPLSLYFFSYFFLLTNGITQKMTVVGSKTVVFFLTVASFTWPFYQLLTTGAQTKEAFFATQLQGLLFFGCLIFSGLTLGMIAKAWREKKQEAQRTKAKD